MEQEKLLAVDPLRDQLRGFARSLAEIEWLLLILVLLYMLVPEMPVTNRDMLILGMVLFTAFILVFHYANFFRHAARWKLAVESWAMIAFITAVVWQTGRTESVLLNLYLLAIIASALTLGRITTLLEVALITACYFLLGNHAGHNVFSIGYLGRLMSELAPFLLVAYLTTMLASDVHRANERIHALAGSDELTGLLNMRGFMSILQREHQQAERYARTYTIGMIDVDNLKKLNDTNGHECGNRALKLVAAVLRDNIRTTDAVARFGGDEFMLLFAEANLQRAQEVVTRIEKRLVTSGLMNGREKVTLQISVGLANYPYNGTNLQELMAAADAAMYGHKKSKPKRPPEVPPKTPPDNSTPAMA